MARRSKYGNVKTVVDGITFDSKAEAARYCELKLLLRGRKIRDLETQPKFRLEVLGETVTTYKGDFSYWERGGNRMVVEDVKGAKTEAFKIKWALAKALRPDIDWRIIPAKSVRATAFGLGTRRTAA